MERRLNNKLWLFAAPVMLAMSGCWHSSSNNNDNNGGGVNPNSAVPSVSSTTPVDLTTDVSIKGNITATFSEAMDPATITPATFTLKAGDTPVEGEVTYAGTVATFNPTADLAANTLLTATITTGVKDTVGDALAANKVWSFTTGSAPSVSSTLPIDSAVDVGLNRNITATFSEAMDPTTINSTTFTVSTMEGEILIPVAGEVTYAGTVANFNPTADLAANKEFTVTITTGAKDLSGDTLNNPMTWKFTTGASLDDTAPTVSSTSPLNLATDVAINRNITATFSEAMDPTTITPATFTVMAGPTLVAGVVSYAGNVATFNPTVDLAANTMLEAKITNGAKDLAGNAIATDMVWTFTTGATADAILPTVTLTAPAAAATNVLTNGNITATFSEAMDPASINATTFTLMSGDTLVPSEVTYADNVATLNPSTNLASNTSYTATLTAGAKDVVGNALASDMTWTFTTGAAGPAMVDLKTASTFGIFAATGITDTDTHTSAITGDVGTSSMAGASVGLTCAQVTGTIYAPVSETGPLPCRKVDATLLTAALTDAIAAYTDAAARTSPDHINFGGGSIGGQTLAPGLYKFDAVSIASDVTLSGGADDIWIFQIDGGLTLASDTKIMLAGGAQAKNIFWQVAGDAGVALGANAHLEGTILAKTKIALTTGATVIGRLLAQAAVTLQANTITKP